MLTLLQAQQQSMMPMLLMLGAMFVIMYFFMIRPQNKRRKELEQFRNNLSIGDKVVTAGGIYGVVTSLNEGESYITVEISKGTSIKIKRDFVFAEGTAPVQQ